MKLTKIEIENFYSIEKAELKLDKVKGLILIEGINKDTGGSNGAGKSVIFEAIIWALFGKTIRKSTEDAMINIKAKKNCRVSLTIDKNKVITRTRKPTSLTFTDGDKVLTKDHAAKTQEEIERTLNTNYKVFMASIVFGQHSDLDFIGATPDDKRVIIKNFLNIDDIFNYRDVVKELKSKFSNEAKAQTAIIDKFNEVIRNNKKDFQFSKEEIDKILPIVSKQSSLQAKDLEIKIRDLEREANKKRENIALFTTKYSNALLDVENETYICNSCGSKQQSKLTRNEREHVAKNLGLEVVVNQEELLSILKQLQHAKDSLLAPSDIIRKYEDYVRIYNSQEEISKLFDTVGKECQEAINKKAEAEKNYDIMRFWEKAFSEQGIVKYVIKTVLAKLNISCNKYLSYLTNGHFVVEFDEELQESIKVDGVETHYISLSGGEKRKINLAVMLALQGLLSFSGKEQSSILFFDEAAENLDEEALKGLYIFLSEIKKTKTVFLITHNTYLKSLLESSPKLFAIKEKGTTELKWE